MAESWTQHGLWSWSNDGAGVLSDAFLVIGLMACLIHFYFSEISPRAQRFGLGLAIAVFLLVAVCSMTTLPPKLGAGVYVIAFLLGVTAATPFLTISAYKPHISRFGIFVLMLSFGAPFGYTVMGRISLAIGRGQELPTKPPPS